MKLYVCNGKHCKKKRGGIEAVLGAADQKVERVDVRCQKICSGPVCGLKMDGRIEWFKEVDSPKSLTALQTLVESGKLKKPLRRRHVPKRSGELRS